MTLEEFLHRAEQSAPYEPCVGSGYCCTKTPCHVAWTKLGDVSAPCPALRFKPDLGHHVCGIYEDAEGKEKEKIAKQLGIGKGCCSNLNDKHRQVMNDMLSLLKEKSDAD